MNLIKRTPFVTNSISRADKGELQLIKDIVSGLEKNGTPVTKVFDHEEYEDVDGIEDVLSLAYNLDELFLITNVGSYVYLIMGQFPDTIADWTTDIDSVIDPLATEVAG